MDVGECVGVGGYGRSLVPRPHGRPSTRPGNEARVCVGVGSVTYRWHLAGD